jgi:hypothetical protein
LLARMHSKSPNREDITLNYSTIHVSSKCMLNDVKTDIYMVPCSRNRIILVVLQLGLLCVNTICWLKIYMFLWRNDINLLVINIVIISKYKLCNEL